MTNSLFQLTIRGSKITIPYHPSLNIPMIESSPNNLRCYLNFCEASGLPICLPTDSAKPQSSQPPNLEQLNVTDAQREKLKWHHRLNHVNFDSIDNWIRQGLIPCLVSVAKAPHPVCAACQFSKARHRSHKQHTSSIKTYQTWRWSFC